jgi:hypothetical protein
MQDVALLFDRAKELRSQAMLSYLKAHVQQFYEHNMAKEAAALRAARVRLCPRRCCVAALVIAAFCSSMSADISRPSCCARACVYATWQLGRPDVDVQFFMYEREQQLSDIDRERARKAKIMSVADRVRFEARQEACDGHVLGAMENLALFWGELSSTMPSAYRLDRLGGRLLRNTNAACAAFDELLRLNPASVRTMHSYAEFISEVP